MHTEICGRHVTLVPALPERDVQQLLAWRNTDEWRTLVTRKRHLVTETEFRSEMDAAFASDRHAQYMIIVRGRSIGTTYVYNYSSDDLHAWVTVYIDPAERKGYGLEAVAIICKALLFEDNLRKVYADVYSTNVTVLRMLVRVGFTLEGVRKGHRNIGGRWVDLHMFALTRDAAMQLIEKMPWRILFM